MNPVKVGLIGFGRMGGFYLDEMQKSGRWDVAYICDVCAESRDLARKLAPGAKVVDDEQVIFDDPEVQVVGLFALADSRKSQIERAFAAGKHVIAEKPISDSIENEWQAVELAENTPLFSTVNLYLRNSWYHNTIKDFIAQGEIGELAIIRVYQLFGIRCITASLLPIKLSHQLTMLLMRKSVKNAWVKLISYVDITTIVFSHNMVVWFCKPKLLKVWSEPLLALLQKKH